MIATLGYPSDDEVLYLYKSFTYCCTSVSPRGEKSGAWHLLAFPFTHMSYALLRLRSSLCNLKIHLFVELGKKSRFCM